MSWLIIIGSILCVGGLAGVIFLVAKKIPTLAKLSEVAPLPTDEKFLEKIKIKLKELRYSSYRPIILNGLEKNLRRIRLLFLKIDNIFVKWIKHSRERSEIWTIKSRAWMEHRRIKKREKAQLLEKLDKVEVSETLETITKEVAKDEDKALDEKIENIIEKQTSGEEAVKEEAKEEKKFEPQAGEPIMIEEQNSEGAPTEEEKKYIDMIAQNPKDVDAYRALGFVYLEQNNYSNARACFRRVLKKRPEDEEIKNKLEEIKGLRSSRK